MSDNSKTSSGGIGFFGLLALFIGLKLGGVINWSWWWVLAPIWAPVAFLLAISAVIFVGAVIVEATRR